MGRNSRLKQQRREARRREENALPPPPPLGRPLQRVPITMDGKVVGTGVVKDGPRGEQIVEGEITDPEARKLVEAKMGADAQVSISSRGRPFEPAPLDMEEGVLDLSKTARKLRALVRPAPADGDVPKNAEASLQLKRPLM